MLENQNRFVDKLEEMGVDIYELRRKVAFRAGETRDKLWLDAAIIGACSSLAAVNLDKAPVIEQVGYLFDECPNRKEFEHMEIVPLVYLWHCLENQLLPAYDEWLVGLIERIRNKHGNNLMHKMFQVVLYAPAPV